MEEVAKAIGERREIWKMTEVIKENGEQPSTTLQHMYGQKKAAASSKLGNGGQEQRG